MLDIKKEIKRLVLGEEIYNNPSGTEVTKTVGFKGMENACLDIIYKLRKEIKEKK